MGDQGSSSPWKWNPGPEFQGSQKTHEEIIDLCSGDAHSAGIKPNTFVRQVLAACLYPELQHSDTFPADVRQRAQCMLGGCPGGSMGSYSSPLGLPTVRRMVAEFITRRDGGIPSLPKNIITCEGPEIGLKLVLRLLAKGEGISQTGVLIPVPSCCAVAMMMEKEGVVTVPYHLCEEEGWALQVDEVLRALQVSRGHCDPRVLYVINPCSSTGHVQSQKSIAGMIRLAAKERLFLLVNEADQDSVYGEGSEFVSYKKVLFEMGPGYSDTVELISFYSISKGFIGEGGLCGGYMELLNISPVVIPKLEILLAVVASPPVPGQIALGAMAEPPEPGDHSHATYVEEVQTIQKTLVRNVQQVQEMLDTLPGVSYQPPMGGHYVFPRLHLPTAALQHAKSLGVEADQLYCRKLLEEEGLCVGPGSEFGQKQGTHHIRLHFMVPPELLEDALGRLKSFHLRFFKAFS